MRRASHASGKFEYSATAALPQFHLRKAQISLCRKGTISRTLCVHFTARSAQYRCPQALRLRQNILYSVQSFALRKHKSQCPQRTFGVYASAKNLVPQNYALARRIDNHFVLAERRAYAQRMYVHFPFFSAYSSAYDDFAEPPFSDNTLCNGKRRAAWRIHLFCVVRFYDFDVCVGENLRKFCRKAFEICDCNRHIACHKHWDLRACIFDISALVCRMPRRCDHKRDIAFHRRFDHFARCRM